MRTDLEKALKGAPHTFGIAEAALLGDDLDRYHGLFEFAAGRIGPRPFGKLRRRVSGFAAKEPGEIAWAHGHAIRQDGHAEILRRVPQNPGLKFGDVWPAIHFRVLHIALNWDWPPGRRGKTTIMRAVALFDGNNPEELALARAQWKELKDLGFSVTYWQQGANGRWERKT